MASMPWFRFYSEAINDPKINRIARRGEVSKAAVLGTWVTLLSLASESPERGYLLLSDDMPYQTWEIAESAGLEEREADILISEFIKFNMLALDGDALYIVNWEKRQFKSDNSSDRVKRFRKRKRNEGKKEGNADETLQERSSHVIDTEADTEAEAEAAALSAFQNNIGSISKGLDKTIREAVRDYSSQWVIDAVIEAKEYGVYKWSYINSILKRWKSEGRGNNRANGAGPNPGEEAWKQVMGCVRKGKWGLPKDSLEAKVIQESFNWPDMLRATEKDLSFLAPKFIKAFNDEYNSHH